MRILTFKCCGEIAARVSVSRRKLLNTLKVAQPYQVQFPFLRFCRNGVWDISLNLHFIIINLTRLNEKRVHFIITTRCENLESSSAV
jgi:hypothetical protein